MRLTSSLLGTLLALLTISCLQERTSEKPPIHLNPNMDQQPKVKAYAASKFFADGSGMRQPVPGTVAVGSLPVDKRFATGKEANGSWVKRSPVASSLEVLQRGQERFNIYCAPCHSRVGDGKGMIVERGMLAPTSFHDPRLRSVEDGYLFDVITHGIRNMSAYRFQLDEKDRWAVVAYLRALQLSQNAPAAAVPQDVREKLDEKKP